MLLTRSPLINQASLVFSFDLHVLSTPPAFVLSQDQTLQKNMKNQKKLAQKINKLTKKSTRKTPQQTTHSLEKNSRHKKLDTLSSSQTTHPQEKPTNQTSPHASLKAPENLTTKISNLSTRFTVNQTATLEILETKIPCYHQNQFKEPALCGSGNYLSPTGPRAVNPKTRAPQHI